MSLLVIGAAGLLTPIAPAQEPGDPRWDRPAHVEPQRPEIRINGQRVQLDGGVVVIDGDGRVILQGMDGMDARPDSSFLPSEERLQRIEIDPRLLEHVDQLDAPDFRTRERATSEIVAAMYRREMLYAVLARETLSVEQRHRLLSVLRQTLLDAPRGAIGISMREQRGEDGAVEVLVADLIPGLPAEEVMRIGDRITAIDGEPMTRLTDLINRVQMRRPGDTVTLSVRRPKLDPMGRTRLDENGVPIYEEMEIDLTLGSADLLVDPRTGQPQINSEVVRMRQREIAAAERRFSTAPRELVLQGDLPEVALGSLTELDELIDRHPAVRTIRQHRAMVAEGQLVASRSLRQHWDMILADLQRELQQPGLPEEHREYLRRVVDRVAQLIPR